MNNCYYHPKRVGIKVIENRAGRYYLCTECLEINNEVLPYVEDENKMSDQEIEWERDQNND